ncbi:MAG: DUF3368 domain-containing protein [Nitrospinae bacterium]|nr:DUF3368 domain-containing protein [Nitrospinota bacterium]
MPEAVISDTSPLQYLHQLGQLHLLPHFYHQVLVPPTVERELAVGRSLGVELPVPATLRWLHVRAPVPAQTLRLATTLGLGEREVLALALEIPGSLVLMDDGKGRRVGLLLSLTMTGTVGVLARATREGLMPQLAPMLDRLAGLGFRLSVEAKEAALRLVGEGR